MNNRWETGYPSATAQAARVARYANARSQMTSSFPPIKRLTHGEAKITKKFFQPSLE